MTHFSKRAHGVSLLNKFVVLKKYKNDKERAKDKNEGREREREKVITKATKELYTVMYD